MDILRYLLALILVGALSVGVVACGDDGGDDDDDDMMGDDDDDMMGDDDDDDDDDMMGDCPNGSSCDAGSSECVANEIDWPTTVEGSAMFGTGGVAALIPAEAGDVDADSTIPTSDIIDIDDTDYRGAFEPGVSPEDSWAGGWTSFEPGDGQEDYCDGLTEVEVTGNITSDTTWETGNCYRLNPPGTEAVVVVEDGATLTIQPGVIVLGPSDVGRFNALVVARGGFLDAQGTAAEPIILTSGAEPGSRALGDFGGLAMAGEAVINTETGTNQLEGFPEGFDFEYGGTNDESSCGTLDYVRIEWTGIAISPDNEIQGLTVAGCGQDTQLNHINIFESDDDGIEFFGGNAGGKWWLISGATDDQLDWGFGWRGAAQFVAIWDRAGERGIEADGNETDASFEPFSDPTLVNITIRGATNDRDDAQGMKLRRGTRATINRGIVADFPMNDCFDVDDVETAVHLGDGTLDVSDTIYENCGNVFDGVDVEDGDGNPLMCTP